MPGKGRSGQEQQITIDGLGRQVALKRLVDGHPVHIGVIHEPDDLVAEQLAVVLQYHTTVSQMASQGSLIAGGTPRKTARNASNQRESTWDDRYGSVGSDEYSCRPLRMRSRSTYSAGFAFMILAMACGFP
jgi:hypothetical protein